MSEIVTDASQLPALERKVLNAANWWHAEINRTRSTSAFHVRLEEFEQELFRAVSELLDACYHLANINRDADDQQPTH